MQCSFHTACAARLLSRGHQGWGAPLQLAEGPFHVLPSRDINIGLLPLLLHSEKLDELLRDEVVCSSRLGHPTGVFEAGRPVLSLGGEYCGGAPDFPEEGALAGNVVTRRAVWVATAVNLLDQAEIDAHSVPPWDTAEFCRGWARHEGDARSTAGWECACAAHDSVVTSTRSIWSTRSRHCSLIIAGGTRHARRDQSWHEQAKLPNDVFKCLLIREAAACEAVSQLRAGAVISAVFAVPVARSVHVPRCTAPQAPTQC